MSSSRFLSVTVVVEALLLMSTYLVQGDNDGCIKTCENYRIVDLPFRFRCTDITDEAERSECQQNCQSCKEICDDKLVDKVYNCPDLQGRMEVTSEGEGLTVTLATYGDEEDSSLIATDLTSAGKSRTAKDKIVEKRERDNEASEMETGSKNSRILVWVALVVVLLIVIVGVIVMICVLWGPRRRNRRNPEVESESGMGAGHRVTSSGSDPSVYYPVIPPETQVVLTPSKQY